MIRLAPFDLAFRKMTSTKLVPVQSTRRMSVPLFGKMHHIRLSLLLPLAFVGNVVLASVARYVVSLYMR